MSDDKNEDVAPTASAEAAEDEDRASKASSEATAPQASPRKTTSGFHHHVVPTEKSGALNVYVQVRSTVDLIFCVIASKKYPEVKTRLLW